METFSGFVLSVLLSQIIINWRVRVRRLCHRSDAAVTADPQQKCDRVELGGGCFSLTGVVYDPPSTAAGLGQSGGYRGRTGEQMQQLSIRHTAAVIRLVLMVFSLSLPAYSQRMENHISPPNFLGQPVPPPASSGRYSPTPKSTLGDDDVTRWEQKHCARARLHWNVSVFL